MPRACCPNSAPPGAGRRGPPNNGKPTSEARTQTSKHYRSRLARPLLEPAKMKSNRRFCWAILRAHCASSDRPLPSTSYALALGRLDTSSCQRVKCASFGAIFMSAKRPPISIATNAVMSAIVKRSPATNWCPFSSRHWRFQARSLRTIEVARRDEKGSDLNVRKPVHLREDWAHA
jgi:hypothetical protein